MSGKAILYDRRLVGSIPSELRGITYTVGSAVPLAHAFGWVVGQANQRGGLDELWLWCHGYEDVIEDANQGQSYSAGGFGLQLCQEDLTFSTVGQTRVFNGQPPKVRKIVVYSCAAADSPGTEAAITAGSDGMRLMGELALWSGARVVASDETQLYVMQHFVSEALCRAGDIDFGQWQGNVYEFSPTTGYPTLLSGPVSSEY
jgi:hypothetical protein